jgi:hypothetical protein
MKPQIAPYQAGRQPVDATRRQGGDRRMPQGADWNDVLRAGDGDQYCAKFCDKAIRVGRSMMTKTSLCNMHSLLRTALVLLFSTTAYSASAQVIPALRSFPRLSAFGTLTTVKPDHEYYGDLMVSGATVGGFLQTRHVVGAEVRGSVMRWGGLEHEESALAGPRFAMHFGRISPYVCVLGGEANAWRWSNPPIKGEPTPKLVEGLGPQLSGIGGLDVHFSQHLVFRVGELSYSKTYLKNWTMTPWTASAGFVYRIN